MAVNIPLVVCLPILCLAIFGCAFVYLWKWWKDKKVALSIKERPLPDLFNSPYVDRTKFKKDIDRNVYKEQALTAAPIIYSGPRSAPATTNHKTIIEQIEHVNSIMV